MCAEKLKGLETVPCWAALESKQSSGSAGFATRITEPLRADRRLRDALASVNPRRQPCDFLIHEVGSRGRVSALTGPKVAAEPRPYTRSGIAQCSSASACKRRRSQAHPFRHSRPLPRDIQQVRCLPSPCGHILLKVWVPSLYHVFNAWALQCAVGRKKIRIEKISDERNRQVAHSRLHA